DGPEVHADPVELVRVDPEPPEDEDETPQRLPGAALQEDRCSRDDEDRGPEPPDEVPQVEPAEVARQQRSAEERKPDAEHQRSIGRRAVIAFSVRPGSELRRHWSNLAASQRGGTLRRSQRSRQLLPANCGRSPVNAAGYCDCWIIRSTAARTSSS